MRRLVFRIVSPSARSVSSPKLTDQRRVCCNVWRVSADNRPTPRSVSYCIISSARRFIPVHSPQSRSISLPVISKSCKQAASHLEDLEVRDRRQSERIAELTSLVEQLQAENSSLRSDNWSLQQQQIYRQISQISQAKIDQVKEIQLDR
jgi:hypothetical protein